MKKIGPWAAYFFCVLISRKFCTGYWVVGPVFGITLLLVNHEQIAKKFSIKHLAIVAASTFIYALVYWLTAKGWRFKNDWLDMLAGSLTGGIVLGSILMPAVHAYLFGIDLKTTRTVSISLIVSWYVVVLLSKLMDAVEISFPMDYMLLAIVIWQGIYLYRLKLK